MSLWVARLKDEHNITMGGTIEARARGHYEQHYITMDSIIEGLARGHYGWHYCRTGMRSLWVALLQDKHEITMGSRIEGLA